VSILGLKSKEWLILFNLEFKWLVFSTFLINSQLFALMKYIELEKGSVEKILNLYANIGSNSSSYKSLSMITNLPLGLAFN